MTTLILLCLALVGVGVLLFALQAWAKTASNYSLKLLCLVMIGYMILPTAQVQADEHKYEPIPFHLLDTTKIEGKDIVALGGLELKFVVAMQSAALFMLRNCRARSGGEYLPPVFDFELNYPGYKPTYVHTSGQCGDPYDDYITGLALLKEWNAAVSTIEIRRDAKQKIAALKEKLKSKQFCDVVLEGTILLREVQDHNERGLGTKGEAARIPDGELLGIIEVAKQGCNP